MYVPDEYKKPQTTNPTHSYCEVEFLKSPVGLYDTDGYVISVINVPVGSRFIVDEYRQVFPAPWEGERLEPIGRAKPFLSTRGIVTELIKVSHTNPIYDDICELNPDDPFYQMQGEFHFSLGDMTGTIYDKDGNVVAIINPQNEEDSVDTDN